MEKLSGFRAKLTQPQRCLMTLPATNKSAATNPARTQEKKTLRRSFLLAVIATAFALLPLSRYGLVGAQDNAQMDPAVQAAADEKVIQFSLVAASDAIGVCFPNAKAKVTVLLTEEEEGTDTFILNAKGLRPNATFAVFLTELPAPPFGAVQYIADFTTNPGGKGSVEVSTIIEEAFVSQPINGQRVRTDLNHVVFWFADAADADACFAPAPAGITAFDGDGVAGPAAMSSRNALPGAPLP